MICCMGIGVLMIADSLWIIVLGGVLGFVAAVLAFKNVKGKRIKEDTIIRA